MGWMRVGGLPVEDREDPPPLSSCRWLGGLPRAFLQAGFHRDVRRIMLSDPYPNSTEHDPPHTTRQSAVLSSIPSFTHCLRSRPQPPHSLAMAWLNVTEPCSMVLDPKQCWTITAGGGRPEAAARPRRRIVIAAAAAAAIATHPAPTISARRTVGAPITIGRTPMRVEDPTV